MGGVIGHVNFIQFSPRIQMYKFEKLLLIYHFVVKIIRETPWFTINYLAYHLSLYIQNLFLSRLVTISCFKSNLIQIRTK